MEAAGAKLSYSPSPYMASPANQAGSAWSAHSNQYAADGCRGLGDPSHDSAARPCCCSYLGHRQHGCVGGIQVEPRPTPAAFAEGAALSEAVAGRLPPPHEAIPQSSGGT